MEVRAGYKQTDLGVIPDEWEVRGLGECVSFRTGPFGSALHKSDYTTDGIPVINPMHIVDGKIKPTRTMTITEKAAADLADFRLKAGEIVIGRRGDMGRCAVVQSHQSGWLCGTGSMIVRPTDMDARFLQRVLSSPRAIAAIEDTSVGTTMVNLNQTSLSGLRVQFPLVSEQRAIAESLSDVDALLGGLDRLIAKKRDLKQAAMQQLLTGQTRLPGFHGEWEVKRLGEVADVKTGPFGSTLHEGDYVREGTPIITVEHLGEFGVEHFNLPRVSDFDRQRLRAYSLEVGDIVFSRVGSVDRNALIRLPEAGWLFSGRLLRVRVDQRKAFAPFLSYQFHSESFIGAVRSVAVGQTMACLNTQILKGIPVTLPGVAEQTAISEMLGEMDMELAELEQRREKTRLLKQGMMQELLTGKTRFV
jgi:type I restriction enzyme, S subunit